MSAYLIIHAKVTDWPTFSQYTQLVPELVRQFGGEYLVMDSNADLLEKAGFMALEASELGSIVVSKWPDVDAAKTFWHSAQYQQAKQLRQGCGEFNVILTNGL
ncbi:DUF1330 domain-containing protein [Thalassotalea sp. HSM 43]|uniref:DUF1330 domain-containing protein n=1 Tax=Thalassotalea sp. HSM 43 TaxID=2552945 RepID=UPI001080A5C5|nr:DUF1330 domain-containing protein [Thalassotalea sp. HSM 43]QBY04569.1 DUF1330 domain-containing protein [Thalassotalea sp. HSM 43]